MRSTALAFVLVAALVSSIGQALRYEPKEPDVIPLEPPCDVVSYWQFVTVQATAVQPVRKASPRARHGDQWLTANDLDHVLLTPEPVSGTSRYLVNDLRHNDPWSVAEARAEELLWIALPLDWVERCEEVLRVVKRY